MFASVPGLPNRHRRNAPPLDLACRLACESLEDRTTPTVSMISSNFNGTAIPGGNSIWFSSVGKVSGVASSPVTLHITNQTISFNGTTLNLPDTTLVLTPGANSAGVSFGADGWSVSAPGSVSGNVFLGGIGYQVPAGGIPGGSIKSITWSGDFTTDTPGISVNWQWAAAVYKTFSADESALGVKGVDSNNLDVYHNSDHAGTPENFKSFVTGGARGGGGSNFTGSYSGTASIKPAQTQTVTPPTQTASLSGQVQFNGEENVGFGGIMVALTDANGKLVATTISAGDGSFSFGDQGDLLAGTYTLTVYVPDGFQFLNSSAGTNNDNGTEFADATDSFTDTNGITFTPVGFNNVTLAAGASLSGYNFLLG